MNAERAGKIAAKIAELDNKIKTTRDTLASDRGTAPAFRLVYSSNSAKNVEQRIKLVEQRIKEAEKAVNNAIQTRANANYIDHNINTRELTPSNKSWEAIVETATRINEHVDKLAAAYFALAIPQLPKDKALMTAVSVILEVDRLHKLNSTQEELSALKDAAITIWNNMLKLRQTADSGEQIKLLEMIEHSAEELSQTMSHLMLAAAERLHALSSARPAGSINRAAGFEELSYGDRFQYINRDLYTCWMENLRWDNTPGATHHTIESLASLKEQFKKDVERMGAGLSINGAKPKAFDHDTIIADLKHILDEALKDKWVERYLPIFYVALSQSTEPISSTVYLQKFARIGLLLGQLHTCCFILLFEPTGAFTFKRKQHYSINRIVPVEGIPAMPDLLDEEPILSDFVITTVFTFVPPVRTALRQRPGNASARVQPFPTYTDTPFTGSLNFQCVLPEYVTLLETTVKDAVMMCDNFVLELMRRLPLPQQGSLSGKPVAAWTTNKKHTECLHQIVVRMIAALAFRPSVVPTITDMKMGWNGDPDTTTNLIQKWELRLRTEAHKYKVDLTSDAIDAELTKKYGEKFDQVTSPAFQYCMRVQDCIEYIKEPTCASAQDVRYVHLALNVSVKKVKGEDKGLKGTYLWPEPTFTSERRDAGFYRLVELAGLISILAHSLNPRAPAGAAAGAAAAAGASAAAAKPLIARSMNEHVTAEGGNRKHRKTIAKRVKKRRQTKKRRHY